MFPKLYALELIAVTVFLNKEKQSTKIIQQAMLHQNLATGGLQSLI